MSTVMVTGGTADATGVEFSGLMVQEKDSGMAAAVTVSVTEGTSVVFTGSIANTVDADAIYDIFIDATADGVADLQFRSIGVDDEFYGEFVYPQDAAAAGITGGLTFPVTLYVCPLPRALPR